MIFADYLSRSRSSHEGMTGMDKTIHGVTISDNKRAELKENTRKDPILSTLSKQIRTLVRRFKTSTKESQTVLVHVWYLICQRWASSKGHINYDPQNMQNIILEKHHTGHQGQGKCQLLAGNHIFWIGMSKDIIETVKSCRTYSKCMRNQQKQLFQSQSFQNRDFEKLATNNFHLDGKNFLFVADYYSKMPFVKSLIAMTHGETMKYME